LSKVLAVAGASGLAASTPNPFASAIPWRRLNVKYAQNEIYFDVVEDLSSIVSKAGTPITTHVVGRIEANARLSGTPDITLNFTNAQNMQDVAFHACVRLQRWTRDKSLSFVPPDGRFVLAEYQYSPGGGTVASTTTPTLTAANQVPVPVALKPIVKLNDTGGTFELTLSGRTGGKAISNICVELFLGTTATGASCQANGEGHWAFDPSKRTIRWEVPALSTGVATLSGSFAST
jgi:AP-3 complex subunit mu